MRGWSGKRELDEAEEEHQGLAEREASGECWKDVSQIRKFGTGMGRSDTTVSIENINLLYATTVYMFWYMRGGYVVHLLLYV